jgi:CubicO group peptidase (beta-lactamase class C family)
LDISLEAIPQIDAILSNLAEQHLFSGSVLIGHQGEVLLSQGYGLADREKKIPNTAQTRYRIASITKQFTAIAILMLADQGRLDLHDPICKFFTDCPAAWEAITIHHLLTHTSGIPDFTFFPDFNSKRATPSPSEQTIARFKDLALEFPPGDKWSYSNSGYVVLGYIIEQASGLSYEEFLQQFIFTPLELKNTGYGHNTDSLAVGYPDAYSQLPADYLDMSILFAAGSLYSTVEDLFHWEQALATEQLVPRKYLDQMLTQQVSIPDSAGWGYGYGWEIGTERGRRLYQHFGNVEGFADVVTVYPDDGVVIIILGNQQNKDVAQIHDILSKRVFGDGY